MSALPLLLGECPSKRGNRYWQFPLSGPPSRVLCELAGIPPEDGGSTYGRWYWALREEFDTRNLFDRHRARWSVPAARERAREVWPDLPPVTVLLGQRVAEAFGIDGVCHSWAQRHALVPVEFKLDARRQVDPDERVRLVVQIPHPSGLNRVYNDEGARARARGTLREAIDRAKTAA